MSLKFSQQEGKLSFVYQEDGGYPRSFCDSVPEDVVTKGKETVKEYVSGIIIGKKEEWRRYEAAQEAIRQNPIPVQTTYKDGTTLEGHIVEATGSFIKIKLVNSSEAHFGYASAMAGHHVFDGYKLSEYGFTGAEEALCRAYEKVLNKPIIDLADELNREFRPHV